MDGKMVIGAGTELLEWDTDVAPIAHFAQPIRWCFPVSGGLGVVLSDMRVVHVERDPASGEVHSTEILPRGSSEIDVADGGKIVIARANGDLLNVVELPSGVRWSVPVASMVGGMLSVAPTTRRSCSTARMAS